MYKPLNKQTVRYLRRIKQSILEDAESFNMEEGADRPERPLIGLEKNHPCFTEACIAGWTVFLEDH